MIHCEECKAPLEFLAKITDPRADEEYGLPYFTEVWTCRTCKLLYGTSARDIVLTLAPPNAEAFFGVKRALGKGDA